MVIPSSLDISIKPTVEDTNDFLHFLVRDAKKGIQAPALCGKSSLSLMACIWESGVHHIAIFTRSDTSDGGMELPRGMFPGKKSMH